MSVLPSATFAGPKQDEALWAVAGSGGGGVPSGVTQLLAGANITLTPSDGLGVVTITAAGGSGGGGVTSLAAGPGVSVSAPSGPVTVNNTGVLSVGVSGAGLSLNGGLGTGSVSLTNTGVTSIVAGAGITASSPSGDVTLTAVIPPFTYSAISPPFSLTGTTAVTTNAVLVTLPVNTGGATNLYSVRVWNSSWSANDIFIVSTRRGPIFAGAEVVGLASASANPGEVLLSFTINGTAASASFNPQVVLIRYAAI